MPEPPRCRYCGRPTRHGVVEHEIREADGAQRAWLVPVCRRPGCRSEHDHWARWELPDA